MSVVTSRSTLLSILKTPNTPRNSFHRVRFQLPNDIRKIFLDFKNGISAKEYEHLVCTVRDSEIADSDLLTLLKEARNCISILNYDLRLFVQALIVIQWTHRNESVVKCYQEFMNDLVSAHSQHTKVVIDQLIKLFLNSEESEWNSDEPNEYQKMQFDNVHFILKSVMDIVPMSEEVLLISLKHNFPYVKTPGIKQISYLYNILRIIKYQPHLRSNILQLVIDKLISLDVLAPQNEVLQAEEYSDLMFEMDVEMDEEMDENKAKRMKHSIADTLDIMIGFVLKFIQKTCYDGDKLLMPESQQLFNELLHVFDNVVFSTHACQHVQFIIFYLCSFHRTLAQDFLKHLWRKVDSFSVPPVIRQTCVAYLVGFLARANYIHIRIVEFYLLKLAQWVHSYIQNHDGVHSFETNIKHHVMFYSICQAMFYLIAFRHQELADASRKSMCLQSLNISKIVTCKLNPLRACLPLIIEKFAAVTRALQLVYCYTVIENNSRSAVPVVKKGGDSIINPVLDMYFPFDDYILKRTSSLVLPLFQEYRSIASDDAIEKVNKSRRQNSASEDDDDFIRDASLGHLSITPVRNSLKENFSFGID